VITMDGWKVTQTQSAHRRFFVFGALAACLISGCQFAYEYEVRGVIRDVSDDTPLAGVTITLKADSLFKDAEPCVTGGDGTFALTFKVSDGAFSPSEMPSWSLAMVQQSYHEQVVDISPSKEPQRGKAINLISVVAYMKPLP
jgi:hypothetical protein